MRSLVCLLALGLAAHAGDWGRTLRAAKGDNRERRAAALARLAKGELEATSRSEAAAGERVLSRFLSDRFPGSERALAVLALDRLDRRGIHEKILRHLEDERDDRVLRAAERAFADAPERVVRRLVRLVDDADDPVERAVYIRVLGAMKSPEARRRTLLRARIADHWCPWSAAILALPNQRDTKNPALFEPILPRLDDDDPALVAAAIEALTGLTGRDYGPDVEAWKEWWSREGQADPFGPPPAPEAPDGAPRKPDARTYAKPERRTRGSRFFGIPVTRRKVAFVFDVSGSMRYKLPLAYDQLKRAVKALPSEAVFDVIFFNEHVWPWRDRLCRADPVTKELLVRHLPTIEIRSYTNLYDSIERALEIGAAELFVISDGEPNRGRYQHPRDVRREVKELNAGRAKIHTVSVVRTVDGDEHLDLLAQIAKDNDGRHERRTLR